MEKLSEFGSRQELNEEGTTKYYLLELDAQNVVKLHGESEEEGQGRHALQDHVGQYGHDMKILHFEPEHDYWKKGLYYKQIDRGLTISKSS